MILFKVIIGGIAIVIVMIALIAWAVNDIDYQDWRDNNDL